jgi:hypothetical protein
LHGIFTFKIVGHIFWHRLMVVAKKLWYTQILAHILGGTYCDLQQLDGGASNVQNFFFTMSQFDWHGPPPNKLNLWTLYQAYKVLFSSMDFLPLAQLHS